VKNVAKLKSILLMSTLGILLSGCSNLEVLNPKGPMAEDSHFLIIFSIIMMVFIVVVVLILFLIFIIKYRKTKNVISGTMHHNMILFGFILFLLFSNDTVFMYQQM